MINLVPDEIKLNTRYGVKNNRLLHWALAQILVVGAILALTGISILSMHHAEGNLQSQLDYQNQRLQSLKSVETEGQQLANQLNTIEELLNRQIKFSELLPQMATIMPPGSILDQLNFSATDLTGGTSKSPGGTTVKSAAKPFAIKASVTNRIVAATLLENIKARTDLFTGADILDVSQNTIGSDQQESSLSKQYPFTVTINAYFKQQQGNSSTSKGQKP